MAMRKRTTQRGRGIKDTLKKVHDFVKARRLISGGLSHLGYSRASGIAKQLGYGSMKRKTQRGGSIRATLKKLHDFAKTRRIVSGGLKHFGFNRASGIARQLGYGTGRKRRTVRRRQRGGNIFSSIGNFFKKTKLISGAAGLIPGIGGLAGRVIAGQLGVGRRRVRRRTQRGGSLRIPPFIQSERMWKTKGPESLRRQGGAGRLGAVMF